MPEAPWARQCRHQNFQPAKYLGEINEPKPAKPLPQLPPEHGSTMFLQKYVNLKSEKSMPGLLTDPNVVGDIEELSDTDKVSLISDIELPDVFDMSGDDKVDDGFDVMASGGDGPGLADGESTQDLQLASLKELNRRGRQQRVKKVASGVKISKQKFLCRHRRSCSSCYRMPVDEDLIDVANAE